MQGIPGSTTEETASAPPPSDTANTSSPSENSLNGAAANGSSAVANQPPSVPEAAPAKIKKKRANPVYITPVRKRERKRSCSDSDNEDGITGDDSAWGPGGKRKKGKGGKKKGGAGGGKKKGKKGSDSDWGIWFSIQPSHTLNSLYC